MYGPNVIRLILENFEPVKCCLLFYRQVNKYNQIKAGSLFYSRGQNYRWPVKTVPLREFYVRSLRRISRLIIQLLIIAQLLLFPTIFCISYILTESLSLTRRSLFNSVGCLWQATVRFRRIFFFFVDAKRQI